MSPSRHSPPPPPSRSAPLVAFAPPPHDADVSPDRDHDGEDESSVARRQLVHRQQSVSATAHAAPPEAELTPSDDRAVQKLASMPNSPTGSKRPPTRTAASHSGKRPSKDARPSSHRESRGTPLMLQRNRRAERRGVPPWKSSHAGYSYSGPAAAYAYRCIDVHNMSVPPPPPLSPCLRTRTDQIRTGRSHRVFVLGPSHHVYLDGCALSRCTAYDTPIGQLPLDLDSQYLNLSRSRFRSQLETRRRGY